MRARARSDRLGPPGPSAIITRPSRMTHAARTRPPARRTYRPRRRARVIAVLVLAAAVAVAAGGAYLLLGRDEGPTARDALDGFAAAWSRGDDRGAAADTTQPAVAAKALVANRKGLDGAKLRATVTSVTKAGDDAARGRLRLTWQVPEFGRFAYTTRVTLHRDDEHGWRVDWRPAVVHPVLDGTNRLGTAIDRPGRASILDRDGRPLVTERAVVRVGVARNKVTDVDGHRGGRREGRRHRRLRLRARDPQRGAPAVRRGGHAAGLRVRREEGRPRRDRRPADDRRHRALGPTKGFARAVLGTVGPVTAEQLERLGPTYGPGGGGRPDRPRGPLREAARRHADAEGHHPPERRRGRRHARRPPRDAGRGGAHDPRPRRADRGRAGARQTAGRRPRSSPCGRRPATSSRSPTGRRTRRSTARSAAATRRARRSRSSARPRSCATA